MIVTCVRWAPYRIPFRAPYVTSQGAVEQREGLILELLTEDGHMGLGEAAPDPSLGVSSDDLSARLKLFAGHLLGARLEEMSVTVAPDEAGAPDPTESAIACAIDVATVDALSRAEGVSAAALLSPTARAAVLVNTLVTASEPEVAQDEAAVAVRAGFRTVKLKVGALSSLEEERERVAGVRWAIGPFVKLRLDPNGAWHEAQAIAAIRAFAQHNIEYVEQPVPARNPSSLARVQAAVDTPVAADEDVVDLATAGSLIALRAVQVLVLKPQRLGGLRPALDIASLAEAAGIRCAVTTSIETGIGTAACLHLAAALPGQALAHGLATARLLRVPLTTDRLEMEDGTMSLPDEPGLGVHLDEAALKRHGGAWREVRA
jgi:o-succinylbenzoate synthase